jgi:hypothetical protein
MSVLELEYDDEYDDSFDELAGLGRSTLFDVVTYTPHV